MARAGMGGGGGGFGGGGGGGRSSGGGGGRSFGGRSSGNSSFSSPSRSASSSGSSRSGQNSPSFSSRPTSPSGGLGSSPPPRRAAPPPPSPPPSYRPPVSYHYHRPHYRHTRRVYYGGPLSNHGSTFTSVLIMCTVFILAMSLLVAIFQSVSQASSKVTASTIERVALPKTETVETAYYTDDLDWIGNVTTLQKGMKNFYTATGVQPHLYITDNIDGIYNPTAEELETWMNATYNRLFTDEGHLLLLFLEYNDEYSTWYMAGRQAKTVIDQEAADILLDCVDRYYFSDMSDEEMFSKAFDDAGERIMTVPRSPWPRVFILAGVVAILIIAVQFWKKKKAQDNLEAEQTERILNTPLESLSADDDSLSKKYDDM